MYTYIYTYAYTYIIYIHIYIYTYPYIHIYHLVNRVTPQCHEEECSPTCQRRTGAQAQHASKGDGVAPRANKNPDTSIYEELIGFTRGVNIYIYIHIYIYIYICIYIYIYVHIYTYTYIYVYVYILSQSVTVPNGYPVTILTCLCSANPGPI